MKIRQIMRRDVVMVQPHSRIGDVLDLMIAHDLSGVPVVNNDGELVGWIPERHLMVRTRAEIGRDPAHDCSNALEFVRAQRQIYGKTASDIMVPAAHVATIQEGVDVNDALEVMFNRGVSRLPVLRGRKVVGYLTRADILKAFRNLEFDWCNQSVSDDDIKEMAWQAMRRCRHVDKSDLHIDVQQGMLQVSGAMATLEEVKHVEAVLHHVPGVKSFENRLVVDKMLV